MGDTAQPPVSDAAERLRRLVGDALDEQIAAAAVAAAYVTDEQLEAARGEQANARGGPPRVTDILVARGLLDAAKLAALQAQIAADAFVRSAPRAELPPEARAVAEDPARALGEFVLVAMVGQGGAGEVWKAWDRRLARWVAIKISTAAPASARERFEREAMAAGRLRHPGLVPVYQVGVDRGRPYLVMPLIEGETLETARLPVTRALEVLQAAALAIEHAHAQGLVHRDLKPGNVMIDRAGNPHVLDFGLVCLREGDGVRLTQPGDVLGTAGYMSPEQARGDAAAAASPAVDVYGLGATLYHALAGAAPFEAPTFAAVVAQVIDAEPRPLRQIVPGLDPRIEAVVLRALDKDPRRRYPTAAAFAQELGRLLRGEDVAARATPRARRLWRALGRRRDVVAIATALVIVGAVAAGARLRVRSERQAAVETLRQMARVSLETALALRRAGDLAGMRRLRPALVAAYETARARGAETAEVEYLVGRMHRALLEEDDALAHQERALAREPGFAPSLYERAVLRSARLGRLLDAAEAELRVRGDPPGATGSASAPAVKLPPDLARLHDEIRRDLAGLQARGGTRGDAEAARGILAYHERHHDEAISRLQAAVAADPLREEAWDALARATEGARRWSEAEEIYTRAMRIDRGYLAHALDRCALRRRMGKIDDAIEDASAVLALDAGSAEARLCRGGARTRRAHDEITAGRDPSATLDQAARDFDDVLAARELGAAYAGRAVVHRYRAVYAERQGRPPMAHLDAAERDIERALAREPGRAEHWASRARTRTRRGMILQSEGGDPGPAFSAAEADYAEALRRDASRPETWSWRAELRLFRARYRRDHGEAAEADLTAADVDLAEALRLYAGDPLTYLKRGELRKFRGELLARGGKDPLDAWREAERDLAKAVEGLPGSAEAWTSRGDLLLLRARHLAASHRSPDADLAAAAAAFAQALTVDPKYAEAWLGRGEVRSARGDRAGARADLERAAAIKPRLAAAASRLVTPSAPRR